MQASLTEGVQRAGMQASLTEGVRWLGTGGSRYRRCRRRSHGAWRVVRQWRLPSLSGTLWFLVYGLCSPTHFWILSAEQLALQGS